MLFIHLFNNLFMKIIKTRKGKHVILSLPRGQITLLNSGKLQRTCYLMQTVVFRQKCNFR